MSNPFSFTEITEIPSLRLREPSFVTAYDRCRLAYYPFIPTQPPKAIVLFYPGAGFYANNTHQWIARQLQDNHNIGVYLVDIRGHGNSAGPRGDAPSIERVWQDVSDMIGRARLQHKDIPIYLAGHSSGAGLLLNYAAWPKRKDINGLILLAPYLGPASGVLKEHTDPEKRFAKKIRSWVYALAGMSSGRLCAHIPAVYFNYPDLVLKDNKILTYYTFTMSCATTPYQTKDVFEAICAPVGIFIAGQDEQFMPDALAKYADHIPEDIYRYVEVLPDAKHLSILLDAPSMIAQMVERFGK